MRMVVLGLGYLGATHAACMAELGHEVLGIEVVPEKRAQLAAGEVPFYEPGLPELLKRHIDTGALTVSGSYQEAADFADVFFIAVGTPQKKGEYGADLSYVDSAVEQLVPLLTRDALILGKSTVPVGTARRLSERADELAKDVEVEIAWNPEFLREGFAVEDTLHPDRLVLGAFAGGSAEVTCREIYAAMLEDDTPFIVTDPPTAELVKTSANAFLATKISFINAIAEVCDAADADVKAVADAIGFDARIGRRFLNAGLGFGGGCLPKDIRAFMARAGELGAAEALSFLREVDNVNMRRRTRMVELARKLCGGSLLGKRIAVLGAAFKPESDDVRDSPALNVAGQIQLQGASVAVYDPKAMDNSRRVFPTLDYAQSAVDACEKADVVLVLTEWSEFRNLDPHALATTVRSPVVVDGRMCLDGKAWEQAGWTVCV
ncbi:UDP-glucose dehydrogenase family protein [Gordonia alkanivorans]|uniref:UDP-glucose dehydrogenase family protein n=1 Tax=Gordonia alkanivorans TaxID=84096 RepID=UPI002448AB04|nr:UDP-glucose/GDP-mannose dehydrogenase family protein [Gordonia alkanivorans]MDH3046682.1 UDP-glucose/GDP-mannose dehydrogenase family protein [Gordonia alkanivorans]MDJ0010346.1 UDP-glucose/GDP-mannose dehydrogenase family protein [Gordonia alkanivorans]MDJ0100107.1 UDP-glucose/GDP-mannose dehydrogenase family protein [Gordonia alkanivorans]MDJ0495972.1 UDP-glucose/GDP-mannose dehydrogenase family protein [Gordonia alkanivorans]